MSKFTSNHRARVSRARVYGPLAGLEVQLNPVVRIETREREKNTLQEDYSVAAERRLQVQVDGVHGDRLAELSPQNGGNFFDARHGPQLAQQVAKS